MTDAQRKGKVSSFTSSHKTPSDFAFGEIAPIALYSSTLSRPWRRGLIVYARKTPPTHTSLSPFSPKVMLSSVGCVRPNLQSVTSSIENPLFVRLFCTTLRNATCFVTKAIPITPVYDNLGKKACPWLREVCLNHPRMANWQFMGRLMAPNLKPF